MKPSGATVVRWGLPAAAVALIVLLASLRAPAGPVAETRFLMDTLVTVTLSGIRGRQAETAFHAAFAAMDAVDREMGRAEGTPLWQLNAAGSGNLSPALAEVLASSLSWARRTDGGFDPTLARLLDLWDVGSGPHPPPGEGDILRTLQTVGWERVHWDAGKRAADLGGAALDFGGIAKGYAIDRAAEALRAVGARDFLVDAGGDLYLAGRKGGSAAWRVGIRHPRRGDGFLRIVEPVAGALVTSGDYERAYLWEDRWIHHILDPRTGYPASGCQSVTVWAPAAIDADALATAVFVLGPVAGLALLQADADAEGLIVDREGVVHETDGFSRVVPEGSVR